MAAATVTSPSDYIHTAMLQSPANVPPASSNSTYPCHRILANEIKGLDTFAATFTATHTIQPLPQPDAIRLFFFYRGSGSVTADTDHNTQCTIDDMALFVPHPSHTLTITTTSPALLALELHWHLTSADGTAAAKLALPYMQPYSTARTYKEAIKSPRTTSRTLLPPGTIPRLAIGSVQTIGPDRVAAHSHPMLEQLFMGVRGCDCVVECDGVGVGLVEGEVLHIPLGSMHGVVVSEGRLLEYLWFDFFLNQEDGDRWIATMHTDDPV